VGLQNTSVFLNNDAFTRSRLGSEEVSTSQDGILGREARLLLIYLNDNKNFSELIRSLGDRKMFKSVGGVAKCLELLIDLEYVVCESYSARISRNQVPNRILSTRETHLVHKAANKVVDLEQRKYDASQTDTSTTKGMRGNALQRETLAQEDEAVTELRHTVALLIEKHAESEVKQTYLEALSKCHNLSWIFGLVQEMQRLSSGEFEKVMYLTALAFKRAGRART